MCAKLLHCLELLCFVVRLPCSNFLNMWHPENTEETEFGSVSHRTPLCFTGPKWVNEPDFFIKKTTTWLKREFHLAKYQYFKISETSETKLLLSVHICVVELFRRWKWREFEFITRVIANWTTPSVCSVRRGLGAARHHKVFSSQWASAHANPSSET